MIQGHKQVNRHRDGPAPPGCAVQVVRFFPEREAGPRQPVSTPAALRRVLASYRRHKRLVVELERDGGESGSLLIHIAGDRAWVTHFTEPGGVDSYCRDAGYTGPDQTVGFLLGNGQRDDIHRSWTVTRGEARRALEYFVQHGERDPGLDWAEQPRSLQERAATRKH